MHRVHVSTINTPGLLDSYKDAPSSLTDPETSIRLCYTMHLKPHTFQLVPVTCDHDGLITVQPHWRATTSHVMAANGIAEVRRAQKFHI